MPIAFTLLFGFAFGATNNGESQDPRLPVAFLDLDNSQTSEPLLDLLADSEVIRIVEIQDDPRELETMVNEGEFAAAIILPVGYGSQFISAGAQSLTLYTQANDQNSFTISNEVEGTIRRLKVTALTASVGSEIFDDHAGFDSESDRESYYTVAFDKTVEAWEQPPVELVTNQTGTNEQVTDSSQEGVANAFSQTSPGMMAQFAIAGLMGAAAVIVLERKNRALHRLLTTPITRAEIFFGHFLAMFTMIFVQLMILMLFGQIALQLNYFGQPLASLLMVTTTALFAASLGLLIGALAKNEDQVNIFALIPMFVLAGLGGAWVPLEITPENFQRIARLTPVAWIIDGFQDIIIRGQGLEAVWLSSVVLLGYAGILFIFAIWRFRFE
jgi:ABC-2 type transport system permease protein